MLDKMKRHHPKAQAEALGIAVIQPNEAGANGRGGGGGGGWKARLKERCINRVKRDRERLVQVLRGLTPSPDPQRGLLLTSPQPVHSGNKDLGRELTSPTITGAASSILEREMNMQEDREGGENEEEEVLSPEEHLELMRNIEEALQEEIRAAEEQAVEVFYTQESEAVEATVESLYDYDNLPDIAVLCPSCKENYLIQNVEDDPEVILCSCGLRIESKCRYLSLDDIQEKLAVAYANHRSRCSAEPVFYPKTQGSIMMMEGPREGEGGRKGDSSIWIDCLSCGMSSAVAP